MNSIKQPRIGEVYMMKFDGCGSVQHGWRPGIIIQNNIGNSCSPNIIALPLTSSLKKTRQPTHVLLPASKTGLIVDSIALCENPETISKETIGRYITEIPKSYMGEIAKALLLSMPMLFFLDQAGIIEIMALTSKLVLI